MALGNPHRRDLSGAAPRTSAHQSAAPSHFNHTPLPARHCTISCDREVNTCCTRRHTINCYLCKISTIHHGTGSMDSSNGGFDRYSGHRCRPQHQVVWAQPVPDFLQPGFGNRQNVLGNTFLCTKCKMLAQFSIRSGVHATPGRKSSKSESRIHSSGQSSELRNSSSLSKSPMRTD